MKAIVMLSRERQQLPEVQRKGELISFIQYTGIVTEQWLFDRFYERIIAFYVDQQQDLQLAFNINREGMNSQNSNEELFESL